VSQHKNELQNLLHEKKINIALITETHFTQKSNFNNLGNLVTHYTKLTILMVLLMQVPQYTIHNTIQHHELLGFQVSRTTYTNNNHFYKNKIASVYCPHPVTKLTTRTKQYVLSTVVQRVVRLRTFYFFSNTIENDCRQIKETLFCTLYIKNKRFRTIFRATLSFILTFSNNV